MAEAPGRYKIKDDAYKGVVFSVGEPIPFSSGTGQLREIIVTLMGKFNTPTYVPFTLFNEDAISVVREDVGRDIEITGCLQSRQWTDKKGMLRWSLSYIGSNIHMGPKPIIKTDSSDTGEQEHETVQYGEVDDLPF